MKKYILLLILMSSTMVLMAQKTITGVVFDETGKEPLPGASVLIKGTTVGTITNIYGKYSLNGVKSSDILVFSFLGYKTAERTVGDKKTIDVSLQNEVKELNDVVIVGYGTSKRSDLTGAVASVNSKELAKTATSNFDEALAGRIAGVQISSTDGTPGEKQNIVIRGGNSITGDNSPLYVIDGIPLEDFDPATLSTDDIENFEVLKDASATAIYGSRGANGVIQITTKNGRTDGKTDFRIKGSSRLDYIPSRLQVLEPYEYVKYQENVAYAQDGYNPTNYVRYFKRSYGNPSFYKNSKGIDWQDEVTRTANTNNIKANISGGTKSTNFYYSGELLNQEGTLINTSFEKIINNLKLTHKINKKARITAQIQYSYMNRKGTNVRGNSYTSVIRDVVRFRPVAPLHNDVMNDLGFDPMDTNIKYFFNPLKNLKNTDREYRSNVVRGIFDFGYKFNKHLNLKVRGSYQLDTRRQTLFVGKDTYYGTFGKDKIYGTDRHRKYSTLTTSNTLTYKNKTGGHNYSLMAGMEAQKRNAEFSYAKSSLYPTDDLGIKKMQIGAMAGMPETDVLANNLLSFFGRLTYSYRSKYLLTATMRADGSSKFQNNPWGYFPSFSTGWRINQEKFAQDISWLSNAKLRLGWGLTGNNRIPDFASYSMLNANNASGYVWGNDERYAQGAYQSNVGVPDLKWEKTAQFNVGLDLGFFRQKITATFDYYKKNTTDLLLFAEAALHGGFERMQQNIGEVQNTGFEFVLNTVNIQKPNFKWTSTFNISFNKNKVIALSSGQNQIFTNPQWDFKYNEYQYITKIGEPVGMIYGLKFDGLYQVSDFVYDNKTGSYSLKQGVPDNGNSVIAPGSLKFVDQNNDNTINSEDRVIIGNPHPDHIGGFSNNFEIFKHFDVSVLFQWSYGFDILNANKAMFGQASSTYNGSSTLANMWTPYNTNTEVATRVYDNVYGNAPEGNKIDDRFVEDGSFLRLKTISIGYNLPKSVLKRVHLNNVRVSISANNLYTWTNYSGYDPDVSVGKYGALTPSLDYSAYPQSTSILCGLDITF